MDITKLSQAERQELGRQIGLLPPRYLHDILEAIVQVHEKEQQFGMVSWHLAKGDELIAAHLGRSQKQMMG